MSKEVVTQGLDFTIEHLDRSFDGDRTTVLTVSGETGAITAKDLAVTGTFTAASLSLSGDVSVDDLAVGDDLTVGGDAAVTGTATVEDLAVTDDAVVGGDLAVTGVTSLTGDVTLVTGCDFILGTSGAGTMIGTGATQKLATFGATPIAQPSSVGQTSGFTAGAGTAVLSDSTFTGGTGTKAYTIGDLVKHLKALGLIASS